MLGGAVGAVKAISPSGCADPPEATEDFHPREGVSPSTTELSVEGHALNPSFVSLLLLLLLLFLIKERPGSGCREGAVFVC